MIPTLTFDEYTHPNVRKIDIDGIHLQFKFNSYGPASIMKAEIKGHEKSVGTEIL